jgi:hypothetical protein
VPFRGGCDGYSTFGGGIAALNDADALTAWTNAQIGDTLIFKFPSNLPAELNGTPFQGVDIAKWASASGERFQGIWPHQDDPTLPQHQPLCTIRLADTRR